MSRPLFAIGNDLFRHCYPLYRFLYVGYKAVSDRQERGQLQKVVRSGMTVVDAGAGIGIYTLLFARLVGSQGRVYAFEPSPVNFGHLEDHVVGYENVTPIQAAVGDRMGRIGLFLSDELNVDHRTYDNGEGRRRIEVPVIRLDDYFSSGTRIDFIKIDVQGYELSVLKGAERIIHENRDIRLLMEFWPHGLAQAGVEPRALLNYLTSQGLSCQTVGMAADEFETAQPSDYADEDQYWNLMVRRGL